MANFSSTWAKTARFLHVIPPPFSQQVVANVLTDTGLSMWTSLVICHQRSQHFGVCRAGRYTQLLESVGSLADGFLIE